MKTVIIQPNYSDEFCEHGWLIKGMRENLSFNMTCFQAPAIAHDIVDHQNGFKRIGGIYDELEAFGGEIFGRNKYSLMSDEQRLSILGGDIYDLSRYSRNCNKKSHPNTRPLKKNWAEDFINRSIQKAMDIIEKNREKMNSLTDMAYYHHDDDDESKRFCEIARHYMRIGYRKAYKRFGGSSGLAYELFNRIIDAIEPLIKPSEGLLDIILKYDTLNARAEAKYRYDY